MSFPSSPDRLGIHLDVAGGIAGDMFVAAMLDALPALADPVQEDVATVQPQGRGRPELVTGTSGGLRVRRFRSGAPPERSVRHSHDLRAPDHGTSYASLRATIASAPLPATTRDAALALLHLVAGAESTVHGVSVDEVHFHELADWDSLLDVVAAAAIIARLQGAEWSCSALPLGGGMIDTAHGSLPVPAPATARLLSGYAWRDDGIAGERVTPTGAAILRHVVPPARCARSPATGRLAAIGHGAGTRELPQMANVLRALVFERTAESDCEPIAVIEFDVDDMTGEEIALAAERMRAVEGVVDVTIGTRTGKKGRQVSAFRLLARPRYADAIAALCFRETSTLGLRIREETRRLLQRRSVDIGAGDARVRVKVAARDGASTAKAEHDDVAAIDGLDARREARHRAERDAKGRA